MAVNMTFVYVFVLTEIPQHMAVNMTIVCTCLYMTFVYVFVLTEITEIVCVRVCNIWQ